MSRQANNSERIRHEISAYLARLPLPVKSALWGTMLRESRTQNLLAAFSLIIGMAGAVLGGIYGYYTPVQNDTLFSVTTKGLLAGIFTFAISAVIAIPIFLRRAPIEYFTKNVVNGRMPVCPRCRYDLRGSKSDDCPECGCLVRVFQEDESPDSHTTSSTPAD